VNLGLDNQSAFLKHPSGVGRPRWGQFLALQELKDPVASAPKAYGWVLSAHTQDQAEALFPGRASVHRAWVPVPMGVAMPGTDPFRASKGADNVLGGHLELLVSLCAVLHLNPGQFPICPASQQAAGLPRVGFLSRGQQLLAELGAELRETGGHGPQPSGDPSPKTKPGSCSHRRDSQGASESIPRRGSWGLVPGLTARYFVSWIETCEILDSLTCTGFAIPVPGTRYWMCSGSSSQK
jgi:hypothetical protein